MLDVNKTRYHLVLGEEDWLRARSDGARTWEYDKRVEEQVLRLQGEIFVFAGKTPLWQEDRRGAAQDRYGHWYWINEEGTGITVRWASASGPERFWSGMPGQACQVATEDTFRPATAAVPLEPEPLAGLAITTEGYLVVGSPTTGSLLIFDLYDLDGSFQRIKLPVLRGTTSGITVPHDLAASPDGGLLVLDRQNKLVWMLDNSLRPVPALPVQDTEAMTFQPKTGRSQPLKAVPYVQPVQLVSNESPVAVEPLPDGTFWVLFTPESNRSPEDDGKCKNDGEPSTLRLYGGKDGAVLLEETLCTSNLIVQPADQLELANLRGHDIAYLPTSTTASKEQTGLIYIADVCGDQAYVLSYNPAVQPPLLVERRYYPLRNFTGAALVSNWIEGEIHYHQGTRWLPVKPLPRMRFEETAALVLPAEPATYVYEKPTNKCNEYKQTLITEARDKGFDGRDPGCVWHRLCLDACIPQETGVFVEARAADTETDLTLEPWIKQPPPYKRPAGSEIPHYALWSKKELEDRDTGTWELLLQQVQGRYLQLRLTLTGNKRRSPALRALRIHYPRFSYLDAYLPAVYSQDVSSMHLVENFLANPEGIFTTIEGLIAQVQVLMDVRSVPAEAIDWLANWLGLAFDPSWTDYQRRLLVAHAPYFFLRRGTLPGLLQAVLLAVHPELGPSIFRDDISCTTIRIVERFLTRRQPGIFFGDSTDSELTTTGDVIEDARQRAHEFVVLLPTTLDDETRRLVRGVVELEKPAHTTFTIKEYWAYFRVGEIRLGIDTVLGQGGRFETFRLGQTALAEGTLGAAFPNDLTMRTVLRY